MHPQDVFPFFTGCQRSGTTLIREIFRAHPLFAIPRESHFIPELARTRERYERPNGFDVNAFVADLEAHERYARWKIPHADLVAELAAEPAGLADAIRRVFALYAGTKGKQRYADKTPRYATRIHLLAELFPESRFVHVIRDGRDVALSLVEMPWGPTTIKRAALYWKRQVAIARRMGADLGPARYMEYRHEDLVDDPQTVVRRICTFLDVEFADEMLRYHETKRPSALEHGRHLIKPPTKGLRDWRSQMSPTDAMFFRHVAGGLLTELGYEPGPAAGSLRADVTIRAQATLLRGALRIRRTRAVASLSRRLGRGSSPERRDE